MITQEISSVKMEMRPSWINCFCFLRIVILSILFCCGKVVCLSEDVQVLLEFRKGIRGDPHDNVLTSWKKTSVDSDGCPVSWHGIGCSNGMITGIDLSNLNLFGEVKLGLLSKLKMLQYLIVSNNSLTGELPRELGRFKSAKLIDLSDNSFRGTIPEEISGMQSIQNLSISGNKITGDIPVSIGEMSFLQNLDLSRNSLSGRIPNAIRNLQHLVSLNLSSNVLGGHLPGGLDKLVKLKSLDLHQNNFSGPVDSVMLHLSDARYIDISCNNFSGVLPWKLLVISSLTQSLNYLNLSGNLLTGSLVTEDALPLFENLKVLDMSNNQLTGPLPAFHFVYALEIIRLRNNKFQGFIPFNLLARDASILTELDLSCNNLSGSVGVVSSTNLKVLNVSSNSLSGPLPPTLGSCAVLDLSNNLLSGNLSVLQTWGNDLEHIDLSCNRLTGPLPNETSQFLRLTYLNLSHNGLVGPLTPAFGNYSKLYVLDLSSNHLSGTLLPSLFTSPTLAYLRLSNNNFTGDLPLQKTLPASSTSTWIEYPLIQYSYLESLELSANRLGGQLPKEIGLLSSLKVLDLSRNVLEGTIPSEIEELDMLVYLNLSSNHLTGKIFSHFATSLKTLDVSYNNLFGIIPHSLRRFNESSFHPGNTKLIYPDLSPNNHVANVESRIPYAKRLKSGVIAALVVGCSAIVLFLIVGVFFLLHRRSLKSEETDKHSRIGNSSAQQDPEEKDSSYSKHAGTYKSFNHVPPIPLTFSAEELITSAKDRHIIGFKGPVTESSLHLQWISDVNDLHTRKLSGSALSPPTNKWPSPGSNSHFSSSPRSDCSSTPDRPVILKVCSPDRLAGELHFLDVSLKVTTEELSRAPAVVLGRSTHGTSYKATLDNGHMLTVKWLREGLAKERKDFGKEIKKLGSLKHPNIISLRGYYWGLNEHEKLILYDYTIPGSLAGHLYEKTGRKIPVLSWNERLRLARDIARGILYLHNEKGFPHGNLKATNVILEGPKLNGKLADYGLHRLMTDSGVSEQILSSGVLGYGAPELTNAKKPKLSFKSDIYAFGVILLEIITGRSASDIESGSIGVVDFTEWVRQLATEGRAAECLDAAMLMGEGESPKGFLDVLSVALDCIKPQTERPGIQTVYENLTSITA